MGDNPNMGRIEMKDIVTGHSITRWDFIPPIPLRITDDEPIDRVKENPEVDHGDMDWMYRCVACGRTSEKRNQLCDECLAIITDKPIADIDWEGFFDT